MPPFFFENSINQALFMKKILLIFSLFTISIWLPAQSIEIIKGVYYQEKQLFTGIYTELYPSGAIKETINIKNGLMDSASLSYYENGNIKELMTYKNGLKDGLWVLWDENGNKISEAFYKDNLKDGKWTIWDATGTKRYEMFYYMGIKIGKWSIWDENGNLVSEKQY